MTEEEATLRKIAVDEAAALERMNYMSTAGTWVTGALTEDGDAPRTPEVDRRMLRIAQRIDAVLNNNHTDARITAYREAINGRLMQYWAGGSQGTLVAQAGTSDIEVGGLVMSMQTVEQDLKGVLALNVAREQVASMNKEQILHEARSWYTNEGYDYALTVDGISVHPSTIAGTILIGLYQDGFSLSEAELQLYCAKAEAVLGVDAQVIWSSARAKDYKRFFAGLKAEWTRKGFDHVFSSLGVPVSLDNDFAVAIDKTHYTNGNIRVSWDIGKTNSQFSHVGVYLVNGETKVKLTNNWLTGDVRGQMYTEVPVSMLSKLDFDSYRLKVVGWRSDETTFHTYTDAFTVAWDGTGDVSENILTKETLSVDLMENAILQYVQMPLNLNDGTWYSALGSTYHVNTDYYAVDLNLTSGKDTDLGKDVFASTSGKVVGINLDLGKVVIEHTIVPADGGVPIVWRTEYLHMQNMLNLNENRIWQIGDEIQQGEKIGEVGNAMTQYAHLHFSVKHLVNGVWQSINLENWLKLFAINESGERYTPSAS